MYSMLLCYTTRITTSIYREASEQESPTSRAGQGAVALVEHRHLRGRLVSMSRVPIRGTLPSTFDQVILGRDLGVIGRVSRASLISRASKANTGSSRANSVSIRANRASGGAVTANRAVVNRVRGEVISEADVLCAVRMAINARII